MRQTIADNTIDRLLTDKQVAERLTVSIGTVRRWRILGQGPCWRKLGALVRYSERELAEYIATRPTGGERAA